MSKHTQVAGQYPVLPLRTEVQLPGHVGLLEVGREPSVRAVEAATRDDNLIVIVPQKNPAVREPTQRDLYEVGVRAEIVQVVKHSPGRFTVVMRFLERVRVDALIATEPFLVAAVSPLDRTSASPPSALAAETKRALDYLSAILSEPPAEREKDKDAKDKKPEPPRPQIGTLVEPDQVVDAAAPMLDLERDDLSALLIETDPMKLLQRIMLTGLQWRPERRG